MRSGAALKVYQRLGPRLNYRNRHFDISPTPPLIFTEGVKKKHENLLNDQSLGRGLFDFAQIWYRV